MESYQLLLKEFEELQETNKEQEEIINNLNEEIKNKDDIIISLEVLKNEDLNKYNDDINELNEQIEKLKEDLENEKNEDKINQLKKINNDLLIYYEENKLTNNIENIDNYNNIKNTCGQTNSLLSVIKNNIEFIKLYCKCEE